MTGHARSSLPLSTGLPLSTPSMPLQAERELGCEITSAVVWTVFCATQQLTVVLLVFLELRIQAPRADAATGVAATPL
eukprot:6456648-Amphidinium_carterae.3